MFFAWAKWTSLAGKKKVKKSLWQWMSRKNSSLSPLRQPPHFPYLNNCLVGALHFTSFLFPDCIGWPFQLCKKKFGHGSGKGRREERNVYASFFSQIKLRPWAGPLKLSDFSNLVPLNYTHTHTLASLVTSSSSCGQLPSLALNLQGAGEREREEEKRKKSSRIFFCWAPSWKKEDRRNLDKGFGLSFDLHSLPCLSLSLFLSLSDHPAQPNNPLGNWSRGRFCWEWKMHRGRFIVSTPSPSPCLPHHRQ